MKHRYIAIEGNIGSGKTSLAHKLAERYGAELILEEFLNNTFHLYTERNGDKIQRTHRRSFRR